MSFNQIRKLLEEVNPPSKDEIDIRFLIHQEQEAISTYKRLALESDNEDVKKVFLDIAEEEIVHVGELEGLLDILGLSSDNLENKGVEEVGNFLNGEGNEED